MIQPVPIPSSTIDDAVEKSIGRRSRSIRNFELGMIVPEVRIFRASLITDDHDKGIHLCGGRRARIVFSGAVVGKMAISDGARHRDAPSCTASRISSLR